MRVPKFNDGTPVPETQTKALLARYSRSNKQNSTYEDRIPAFLRAVVCGEGHDKRVLLPNELLQLSCLTFHPKQPPPTKNISYENPIDNRRTDSLKLSTH